MIIALAAKNRLPAIFGSNAAVANGGLMSYELDEIEPCRRPAVMVDKILKGAKPGDLPVEHPTNSSLCSISKLQSRLG